LLKALLFSSLNLRGGTSKLELQFFLLHEINARYSGALTAKNASRQSGELRKQDFSVARRNVKIVVFQEAGWAYFWLVFFGYFF